MTLYFTVYSLRAESESFIRKTVVFSCGEIPKMQVFQLKNTDPSNVFKFFS